MRTFLLFFTLFSFSLYTETIEIKQMKEVKNFLKADTLIIFDIDNTLIEPVQDLGTDQWFTNQYKTYKNEGLDERLALDKALREWTAVRVISQMQLVENGTDQIVSSLQKQNLPVIGLTTQGCNLAYKTTEQLKSVSIDLSLSSPFQGEHTLQTERTLLFYNGILFTDNTHKGKALFALLNKTNYTPKRVIFINDKASHIRDIEETCESKGIPFIGLRYGYLDDKVKTFNPQIAEVQFQHFKQLLSNEKAIEVLKKKEPNPKKIRS